MRLLLIPLAIVFGLLSFSFAAPSKSGDSEQSAPSRFLSCIQVGEHVRVEYIVPNSHVVRIHVLNENEYLDLRLTAQDIQQYKRTMQFIRDNPNHEELEPDELPKDLQNLLEKHPNLERYVMIVRSKISKQPFTVTRVGEDYLAFRDGSTEKIFAGHCIHTIYRPISE
jgi:hypothetical protein